MGGVDGVLLVEADESRSRERAEQRLMGGYRVDSVRAADTARHKLADAPDAVVPRSAPETIGLVRELRAGAIRRADSGVPVLMVGTDDDWAGVRCDRAGADLALPSCSSWLLVAAGLHALGRRAGGTPEPPPRLGVRPRPGRRIATAQARATCDDPATVCHRVATIERKSGRSAPASRLRWQMIKPMSKVSCYRPAGRSVATTADTSADSSSDTAVDNQASGGVVMVCVCAQQKGGVGKTTSAINAGVLLARAGRRVLAIDVDPQFALTRRLGIDPGVLETTVVDVLAGWVDARSAIVTGVHGLDVLPASRELAGVELALAGEVNRETVLRDALDGLGYDVIVIDTPSNLGLLTVNALVAADVVVAPVAADDEGAAQGVAELRATISKLSLIRPQLPQLVVIVTKAKPRRVMSDVIDDAIASLALHPVTRVPDRAAVEQADVARTPIAISAPDSAVTLAYQRLAEHLDDRRVIA
jgi:chromosome partitioning protein